MVDRWGLLLQDNMSNLHSEKAHASSNRSCNVEALQSKRRFVDGRHQACPAKRRFGCFWRSWHVYRAMVEAMGNNNKQPIIFPLSNPTSRVEATPNDVITGLKGAAIVATEQPV